jgi:hypothetical protein
MKPSVGMRFVSVVMIVIMLAPMISVTIDMSKMIDWESIEERELVISSSSAPEIVSQLDSNRIKDDEKTSDSKLVQQKDAKKTPIKMNSPPSAIASVHTQSPSDIDGLIREIDRIPWEDPNGPDITILNYQLSPSHENGEASRSFTITATIKNTVYVPTGNFWVSVWMDWRVWNASTQEWDINGVDHDPTDEGEDWEIFAKCLYEVQISLAGLEDYDFSHTSIAPSIPSGDHYIELHADHYSTDTEGGGLVIECEEDNNWAPYGPNLVDKYTLKTGDFDLIGSNCLVSPSDVTIGQQLELRYYATNNNPFDAWVYFGATVEMGGIKIGGPDTNGPRLIPAYSTLDEILYLTVPETPNVGGSLQSGYYDVILALWDGTPGDHVSSVQIDQCTKYFSVYIDLDDPSLFRLSSDWRFVSGTTDNFVSWTVIDENPGIYTGFVNGQIVIDEASWESGTISLPIDASISPGFYTASVYVSDSFGQDTYDTVSYEIYELQLPELVVSDFFWVDAFGQSSTTLTSGQPFTLTVAIDNIGTADVTGPFNVRVMCNDEFDLSYEMSGMIVGAPESIVLDGIHISSIGIQEVHVYVDAEDLILEENNSESWEHFIYLIEVQKAEWTFISYLQGDWIRSAAEGTFTGNAELQEMMSIGSSTQMNVVVLFDRYGVDDSSLSLVLQNSLIDYSTNPSDNEYVPWLQSEMNMGDPTTVSAFVNWVTDTFRSENYILVFYDHSTAYDNVVAGICRDESNSYDLLTINELQSAMSQIHTHIEIVGFDICMMAQMEVAYALKDNADIIIATEELSLLYSFLPYVQRGAWPYDEILFALDTYCNQGGVSAQALSIRICEEFEEAFDTIIRVGAVDYPYSDDYRCISAFNVHPASYDLNYAIDNLAEVLLRYWHEYYDEISDVRLASEDFSRRPNPDAQIVRHAYIDVYDFARRLKESSLNTEIDQAAQLVLDVFSLTVIPGTSFSGVYHPNANGISTYLPRLTYSHYPSYLEDIEYFSQSHWFEFVKAFHQNSEPQIEIELIEGSIISGSNAIIDWTCLDDNYDFVYFEFYVSTDGGSGWSQVLFSDTFSETPVTQGHILELDTTLYPYSTNCVLKCVYKDYWPSETGPHSGNFQTILSETFTIDNRLEATLDLTLDDTIITYTDSFNAEALITPLLVGKEVWLQYSTNEGTTWGNLNYDYTRSDGRCFFTWAPFAPDDYIMRCVWNDPDGIYRDVISNEVILTVLKIPTSINLLSINPTTIGEGDPVVVSGQFIPNLSGMTVYLEMSIDNGQNWNREMQTTSDSLGYCEFTWYPFGGNYLVRIAWDGNSDYLGSSSTSGSLTVTGGVSASSISLSAIPSSISVYSGATIQGTILSQSEGDKSGVVKIEYSGDNGASWSTVTTVTSDISGIFSYWWEPLTQGNFLFKASWTGNEYFESASSNQIAVNVYTPSVNVLFNCMCRDVYGESGPVASQITDQFLSTDEFIYLWLAMDGVSPGNHLIQWRWYLPDGETLFAYTYQFRESLSGYLAAWSSILIDDYLSVFDQYDGQTLYVDVLFDGTVGIILFDSFSVTMVKSESSISLSANPTTVNLYYDSQLSGQISSPVGGDKSGTVLIEHSSDGGSTWEYAGTTSSDSTGAFTFTWDPPSDGSYQIRASWSGNYYYNSASSNVVTVSVYLPNINVIGNFMCHDVESGPYPDIDPIDITEEFSTTDDYIYSWVYISGVPPGFHVMRWWWYEPDGVTMFAATFAYAFYQEGDLAVAWSAISIEDYLHIFDQYDGQTLHVEILFDYEIGVIEEDTFIVRKVSSSNSIQMNGNAIFGDPVLITSTINPVVSDGEVIFEYSEDQVTWEEIGRDTPNAGLAGIDWTPPSTGTFYVKATWTGNHAYYSSMSSVLVLNVDKAPSVIQVELSSARILDGDPMSITASLTPAIEGGTVIMQWSSDGINWNYLYDDLTGPTGEFTYTFDPGSGSYFIQAYWNGDDNYLAATSSVEEFYVNWKPSVPVLQSSEDIVYNSQFDVFWSEGVDQDGSVIQYTLQISSDSEFSVFDEYVSVFTDYQFIDMIPGTYYIRVQAIDNDGQSGAWSNIVQVTVVPPNTPAGNDIVYTDGDSGVSLTFSDVNVAGQTTVTLSTQGQPPDEGYFMLMIQGNTYIDITTTAIYSGPLIIAIPFDLSEFNENNPPKLRHIKDDNTREWVEIWFDFENNIIYGEVDSLSTFLLEIDLTPPETTITLDGTLGENEWYISNVLVSFDYYEPASLPVVTTYSYDNITWFTYSGPFTITAAGSYILTYNSTDAVGNSEELRVSRFKIDKTDPSPCTSFTSDIPVNYWTSDSTINIEWYGALDPTSGVYGYSYEWSQAIDTLPDTVLDTTSNSVITTLTSGIWYLHIRTRDAAGNWGFSAYHIGPFKIDTSPPTASVNLEGQYGMNNWFVGTVLVSVLGMDSYSGVDYILYSLDDGPWLIYSGPFSVSGDLAHRVDFTCVDHAGIWSEEDFVDFVIDTTPPDTYQTVSGNTNPEGEYLNNAVMSFTIYDNLDLHSYTEFRVNEGPWQRYNGPFTISQAGNYRIDFYSVDYAGNIEDEDSVIFDVKEVAYFFDDFVTQTTGYDPTVWTQESYGPGSFWWDSDTLYGLTASGHGHRTLVSNEVFQPDVKAKMNLRMTNYASWEPVVCFGWTDRTTSDWNYHFLDGQNGVWLELNWPQQDWFMLYSKKNGQRSELRINIDFTQFHGYEIRWTTDEVILYIDGEIYGKLTSNVPTVPLQYKMTVTAWSGNTPNEWLYVDSVEVEEAQAQDTVRGQIHAVGDDQGRVHLFQLDGLNLPQLLWTKQLTGTLVLRILVADVDQNGRNEVLAGTNAGWLYCLDGETGDIIWSYYTPWSGFYSWLDIFVTNLDNDNMMEIVTAAYCKTSIGGGLIVLEHNGAVKALHDTPILYGHNGNGPDAIALGDFNNDDIQDVACLFGNVLYGSSQPRIQVVDFSSGSASVLIDFRYGGYAGSGMTNFNLGDLNDDGQIDFVTAGWWCPVGAFSSTGTWLWDRDAPGNADKVVKYVDNINGLGQNAVVIGTGSYSNTYGLFIYFVDPVSGRIISSVPLGITSTDFRPWAVANLDDDAALEVIASSNNAYSTTDRMTILDGGTMQVSWFATIEFSSQSFLPYDLNGDNQAEILAPNGRYISLFNGYGSRIWDYWLGAIPYVQSAAPLRTDVPPRPPTPVLTEVWFDDFDDGNFDGWTVTRGAYSAANYYLEGMTSTWNYIEHPSTTVVGSWSFDYNFYGGPDGIWQGPDGDLGIWFISNDHWQSGDSTQPQSGYFIYFHPHVNAIELWMDPGDEGYNRVLLGSWSPPNFVKSWHVDITRDSNGVFNVYLDGVNRIQATDTTFYTSSFFGFLGYNRQEMDNVVVQDMDASTIDYDGTFTLSWTMEPPSGTAIDYYQLQVSDNPSFTRLLGIWYPDFALLSQDVTLLSPATYFFRIRAFDVNGFAGEWSNIQTMIVSRDTTIPLIDSPVDIIYEEASTGNTRVWNPTDLNPDHYEVYCDGYLVESGFWTGGPLVVSVDGLQLGNYSWTVVVFDTYDNWVSDTLFVTILENEAPEVDDVNTIYEAGTTGNVVVWYPYDFTPSSFEIWFETTCIDSGFWDGSSISCSVDGLDPGVYVFELTVYDATGLSTIALATITVVDTTKPVITVTPVSTTVEEGSFGTEIMWVATDLYPESYILLIDESPFASGPWVGGPLTITIDGLTVGTYNYTLTFIDESGNTASTFVWIYAQDTTPPSIDGPSEIIYEAGSTGNWIYWIASEPHPFEYMISLNGEPLILGLWGGNNIQWNIDGYDPGTYYYTLTCRDVFNNAGSHEVTVIVEDTTSPIIIGSDDLVYEAGEPGHSLTWSFIDLYPDSYIILRNETQVHSGLYTGLDITISVDLLNPGLYNFSFIACDLYGNYAVDLVWVDVEGNTPSGTDVEVPDPDTGVTLTFEETSTPGTTEVVITETGPHPPDDFRLMGVYYNITTTANFDGIIVVAIPYDETLVNGLEKNLKLWHWRESAGWEDCTTLVDEVNNIIYGEVTHLSLFGVMEDNAPPSTSYSLSGIEGLNGWYVSDVSIELTAFDTISEIDATYYSFDEITWHQYSSYISITDEGLNSVFFYSVDVAQNVEETNQIDIYIDISFPETDHSVGAPIVDYFVTSDSEVSLTYSDLISGIASTFYRINGGAWTEYSNAFVLSDPDGTYLIEYYSVDMAGIIEPEESFELFLDNSAPVSSKTVSSPVADNFVTSATLFTLTSTDDSVGVLTIYYRFNGEVWQEYIAPFVITGLDGIYTIEFYGEDLLGNAEQIQSQIHVLDNSAPVTSHLFVGSMGNNDWYVSYLIIDLSAIDMGCGVATLYYSLDLGPTVEYTVPISVALEGTHSIEYWAEDNLGNLESPSNSVDFKIDTIKPDTTATLTPAAPDGLSNWYVNPVDVTLFSDDATSEVFETYYRVNGASWILYVTPVTFSVDGVYLLEFWSVDYAGNQESAESVSFRIDQTIPTTTHSIGEPKFSTDPTYIKTVTPISLTATDNLAGVAITEYRLDMGVWIEYTSAFHISEIGYHTVDYRSWDIAGNLEDYHSFAVFVNAVELTYIGAFDGNYSDPVVLQAELIDIATHQPVSGKVICFSLGFQLDQATTNELGIATVSIIIDQQAGVYTVTATFYTDIQYTFSEDSSTFTINKERAIPEYTGSTVVPTTADEITLRATVFDYDDGYFGNITKIQVTFRIYTFPIDLSSPLLVIGPVYLEQSDVDGVGVITLDIDNLSENGYIIIISLDPDENPFYKGPSSDLVILTIFEPTGDFVTGGGWLVGPSGEKSNFGFNVKYSKKGTPRGQSIYIFREGDWETIVKSNAWIGMAIYEDHAFFEGKCTVQKYNSETGELLWDEGNYQFRVDVWDTDESGGIDVYQIRILNKDGIVFHEVGFNPLGYLGGGNIAIHLEKKE